VTEYHDPERKKKLHARFYGGGGGKEAQKGKWKEGRRVGNAVRKKKKYTQLRVIHWVSKVQDVTAQFILVLHIALVMTEKQPYCEISFSVPCSNK